MNRSDETRRLAASTDPEEEATQERWRKLRGLGSLDRRRLGIAEWTAVNHVRHIMRKLECPSRIHVARWMGGQD